MNPFQKFRPLIALNLLLSLSALTLAQTLPAGPTDPLDMLHRRVASPASTAPSPPPDILGENPHPHSKSSGFSNSQIIPLPLSEIQRRADALTDDQVLLSMNNAVTYLLAELHTNANPKMQPSFPKSHPIGTVSLITYALLQAGRSTDDPRCRPSSPELKPVIDWLLKAESYQTYDTALQVSALSLLPDVPEYREALKRAQKNLLAGMQPQGTFTYSLSLPPQPSALDVPHDTPPANPHPFPWDHSNTQYGLLGEWAAAEAGVPVDPAFWRTTDSHWRATQESDGGWSYFLADQMLNESEVAASFSSPTMTCAGVASLLVTTDKLISPVRLEPQPDTAIEAGLQKIATDLPSQIPYMGANLYYSFGLERVGLASGLKYFDHRDWYTLGAAAILAAQSPNGSWIYDHSPLVGTSFALLFLAHGRNPLAINKMQYSGPWNARPLDDANLTKWLTNRLERPFNWQIVNLNASPDEWLDASILLITGHGNPNFSAADLQRIKSFIQSGGLILSTCDGQDAVFNEAIKSYMSQILDSTDSHPLPRILPPDHPIFHIQYPLDPPPTLFGLSNGLREVWIHSPADLGATWQSNDLSQKENFELAADIYLYATGRSNPQNRLATLAVPHSTESPLRSLNLGRLQYAGNWNPEPGAWPRMALLATYFHLNLTLTTVSCSSLNPAVTPVIHLTGTTSFSLPEDAQTHLRNFLNNGGTLLIDSAGSSNAFTDSALKLLATLYPNRPPEPLSPTDPLFSNSLADTKNITSVDYRKFNPRQPASDHSPHLLGLKLTPASSHWSVLLADQDLTSGLLGTNTWGITGYQSQSATDLLQNMLLYSLPQPEKPQ